MTAYNIVRFRVKPGMQQEFEKRNAEFDRDMKGFRKGALVKTGGTTYCFVGEWESFDDLADARTIMIGNLDRFRDLLDIVMLSTMAPPSTALRSVCEETFDIRQQQGWPPEVVVHPHWIEPMEQRAIEMGLDQRLAAEIAAYVAEYVRRIASAE